jgi:hypothetical protein
MAKIRLNKVVAFILLFCVLVLVYLGCCAIVFFREKFMPLQVFGQTDYLKAIHKLESEYNSFEDEHTKEWYREKIEQDLELKFYFYKERDIERYNGLAYATIRTIVIDEELDGYGYCKTFAHEVMHLKLFIQQEDYVCYETFKYLYESEELHNVGVWYGLQQLRGCYSGKYNISGHVVNYLTNK